MIHKKIRLAALAAAMVLAIGMTAGCGEDKKSSDSSTPAATSAPAAATVSQAATDNMISFKAYADAHGGVEQIAQQIMGESPSDKMTMAVEFSDEDTLVYHLIMKQHVNPDNAGIQQFASQLDQMFGSQYQTMLQGAASENIRPFNITVLCSNDDGTTLFEKTWNP